MRMKFSVVFLLAASVVTSRSGHIMVSPPQSKAGAVQKYELRVHNEAKVAATYINEREQHAIVSNRPKKTIRDRI
jgi:uncharacterized protein YcnI